MKKYIPSDIETKWQLKWDEIGLYDTDLNSPKDKYNVVVELPYTSGDLHIGHWFAFGVVDGYVRFNRMLGRNVYFPIGFDSFGLPAENAAIKRGLQPRDWTFDNVERMSQQFRLMGSSLDWNSKVITCLPEYYKWNQWIFLKMYDHDIAYRNKVNSNWCPFCQTVLADEQVVSGKCDRCGTEVIKKDVDQWLLKITDYADKLEWRQDGNGVDWPQDTMEGQNNWIGRSEGVVINFEGVKVFTTRPDTLFGVTFLVISPEHPLLMKLTTTENRKKVEQYVKLSANKSELERKENKEKTGVFTGAFVANPINGEMIPVWVADYVLVSYGTGAIMGVPAHDERDFEFAKKFGLEIKPVIEPIMGQKLDNEEFRKSIVAVVFDPKTEKYLSIKWKKDLGGNLFVGGGLENDEDIVETAVREVTEETGYKDITLLQTSEKIHYHYRAHSKKVNREIEAVGLFFELKSDQRVESKLEEDEKGKFEVEWLTKNEALNIVKDELHAYVFNKFVNDSLYSGEGVLFNSGEFDGLTTWEARGKISDYIENKQLGKRQIQYHLHDWSISRQRFWGTPIPIIYCDECGVVPVPEKDLPVELPEKVEYASTGKSPLALNKEWYTVKCPKCGVEAKRETDTMDGFIDNSWYFLRYLDPHNNKELANPDILKNWMPLDVYFGGAEHTLGHTLYSRFFYKFLVDIKAIPDASGLGEYARKRINHGVILGPDGARMSKSKGNVINPDEQVKDYGADAVRVYLSFIGPYSIVAPWNPSGINGIYHFLQRVWGLQEKVVSEAKTSEDDLKVMNQSIKKIGEDIAEIKFNTAIATLMGWLNHLSRREQISMEEYKTYLLTLAPFAPHITEELWSIVGETSSIHQQSWPKFDEKYLSQSNFKIVVQVNGRVRDILEISNDLVNDKEVVEKLAIESKKVQKFMNGEAVKNIIYVPGKILNIII